MSALQWRAFREALKNYNKTLAANNINTPNLNAGNAAWNNFYRRQAANIAESNRKRAIVRRIGNKLGISIYRNTIPYNSPQRKLAKRKYLGAVISKHANKARLGRVFHGMAIRQVQARALRNLNELQRNLARR
jgi:hypothetical protein